jgi:formate hydrogenlyase subunit 3/multisubunit Na+/H+ antiporter MnhD subunit
LVLGLSLSLICTIFSSLTGFGYFSDESPYWNFLRFDNLSQFFLFVIQLVAIPVSIYNFSYLKGYIEERKKIKTVFVFYICVIIIYSISSCSKPRNNVFNSMGNKSLTGYFAMLLEKKKAKFKKGAFIILQLHM